ncbi:nicotianamine synthase family protein [Paenibacillus soyae]|uniref:Nicotianamine synthase n=1 Tax=Paenibacillus soyae TaxID=2969249 RepID=A0A9X2MXF9_9BACL|nr:nicotianamine synthase family protein [Paenibacillus soyae]MCR2807678.1 nicotianamine synthase [Paenibacillus soyae]
MEVDSASSTLVAGQALRMQKVDSFIAFLREVNELLQIEIDLSPANLLVTDMIQRLSAQLRSAYLPEEVQAVLGNEYIRRNERKLRDKLSEAEFQAELSDSRLFQHAGNSVLDRASRLPNWNVYIDLVGRELPVLRQIAGRSSHADKSPIVFVGSGPMPLSAIILHLFGDAEVVCLEMDGAAYEASCSLLERIGLGTKVKVALENGEAFDYSPYSRIFVASLVQNKTAVLEQITRTASDPLVAVRTAEGMKQIMYEAVDEAQLRKRGWRIVARTCPEQRLVINSTLFLDRRDSFAGMD